MSTATDQETVANLLPQAPQHSAPSSSSSEDLPTPETLTKAGEITIYDKDGKELKFKDLYSKKHENDNQVNLVIFIRHFYCGNCQGYVAALGESISPEELEKHSPKINLHIVGLGSHTVIKQYAEATQCPFPIYSEPTQELHSTLGLARTFQRGKQPKYEREGVLAMVRKYFAQSFSWGGPMKGGDLQQVGGEFMWVGGECVWCYRMKTMRDHTEVDELRKVIGLDQ